MTHGRKRSQSAKPNDPGGGGRGGSEDLSRHRLHLVVSTYAGRASYGKRPRCQQDRRGVAHFNPDRKRALLASLKSACNPPFALPFPLKPLTITLY